MKYNEKKIDKRHKRKWNNKDKEKSKLKKKKKKE